MTAYTLAPDLGGIVRKPGVIPGPLPGAAGRQGGHDEPVGVRDYLCLTLSPDDDVIGGAPAVRFAERLKELLERDASRAIRTRDATPEPRPVSNTVSHPSAPPDRTARLV